MRLTDESREFIKKLFDEEVRKLKSDMKTILSNTCYSMYSLEKEITRIVDYLCIMLDIYDNDDYSKRLIASFMMKTKFIKVKDDATFVVAQTLYNLLYDVCKIYNDKQRMNLKLLNKTSYENYENIYKILNIKESERKKSVTLLAQYEYEFISKDEEILNIVETISNEQKKTIIDKITKIHGVTANFLKTVNDNQLIVSTDDLTEISELVASVTSKLSELNVNYVATDNDTSVVDIELNINDAGVKQIMKEIVNDTITQSNSIKTRSIALNMLLVGGIKNSSLTLFTARTGGGKSNLLLSCAIDAINPDINMYKTKKTEEPVVLYISNENIPREVIDRIYSHQSGVRYEEVSVQFKKKYDQAMKEQKEKVKEEIENHVANTVFKSFPFMLRENQTELYNFTKTDDNLYFKKANLYLCYMTPDTKTSKDIDDLFNKFEAKGKKIVAIVLDYLSRMKDLNGNSDNMYEQKGAIANQLREISLRRNVPIISAVQLNRVGSDKSGSGKKIAPSDIAESLKISYNTDVILHYEVDQTVKSYATIRSVKNRKFSGETEAYIMLDNGVDGKPNPVRLHQDYINKYTRLQPKKLEQTSFLNWDKFSNMNLANEDVFERPSIKKTSNADLIHNIDSLFK